MNTKVMIPSGNEQLFRTIFNRTKDYIKTKEILLTKYNVSIYLEPIK